MKKKIRFLQILLSLSLALSSTGCGKNAEPDIITVKENPYYSEDFKNSSNGAHPIYEENNNSQTKEDKKSIISSLNVDEKNNLVNQYLDYFKNITYDYDNSEYYLSNQEIDELIRKSNTIKNCTNENVSMDVNEIFEKIRINSIDYLKNHELVTSSFVERNAVCDENTFQSQLIFETSLKILLKELLEESHNDIKEDFCKFESLSICYGSVKDILGYSDNSYLILGYYDTINNAVIIDYDAITILYENISYDYGNTGIYITLPSVLIKTLSHEMNHVRQSACDCRINAGQEYADVSYSEYISFLQESSAESDLYNSGKFISYYVSKCNNNEFSYEDERGFEALILLMGVMNNSMDDYYNAIFDSDVNALFEFLGAYTDEEKHELYRLIYIIDGVNYRNDLIFNFNEFEYNNYLNPADIIGREYRYEIMNKFTISLIEYINNHDDFTILDAMCLFNVAQSVCLEDMKYIACFGENTEYEYIYDTGVIYKMNDTRIKFYEFLKEFYGVETEELLSIVYDADKLMFNAKLYVDYSNFEIGNNKRNDYFMNLFERFPLLKTIMFATNADYLTYKSMYNDIGLKLTLE